jgi:hypothetical protein
MGNAYWAGCLPGLILATIASIGLARLLQRPGLRHIVWLVPAIHFAGAFGVGPALSLLYGLLTRWQPGGAAAWEWAVGFTLAGALAGALNARAAPDRRKWRVSVFVAEFACIGLLIPAFYLMIAA